MKMKLPAHAGDARKIRFWPPRFVHLSDWPPRADSYFVNCYRSIFEHETLCTVEIAKREIHWLHGVAIAQVTKSAVRVSLGEDGGAANLLALLLPVLKHHEIMRGPLRVEFGAVGIQLPEMAVRFGVPVGPVEAGIWLRPEWTPEAESERRERFERDQQARLMRNRITAERRRAAQKVEQVVQQRRVAERMNPVFG